MGQHKSNPTAIAAKNGELPPKPKKKDKRQLEREMYTHIEDIFYSRLGLNKRNPKRQELREI